ncbi:Probable cytochrome P450 6a14 [Eumeta japonica]|uniref:unspecific monooxygenase n=1 Tax=Eumeta variegata TaxID=151549 RepID=A0A4C1ZX14_EUMVA|nr:Probable cytochrome P450 6a14 [Eumeta japonica]
MNDSVWTSLQSRKNVAKDELIAMGLEHLSRDRMYLEMLRAHRAEKDQGVTKYFNSRRIIRTLWFLTPELFRRLNTPRIKPETTEFFLSLVRETAAMREREGHRRNDFLQILLELKNNELLDEKGRPMAGGGGMSWTQMAAHSMVFLAAGFESTSTTAAFTIYELAQNGEILEAARGEIFAVLKKYDGRPTYDALAEMTYLSLVIEETLRKHPPMRALFRRCTKNYHIPGTKVVVERDTWAFVPILAFHNDADIFPEPEKFRPERFLPENRTKTQLAAYMPFGDGPKMCLAAFRARPERRATLKVQGRGSRADISSVYPARLGRARAGGSSPRVRFGMMAVKMALVSFLTRYDFTLSARTPVPMKYSTTALSLVADPGVYVDLKPLKGYDLKVEF